MFKATLNLFKIQLWLIDTCSSESTTIMLLYDCFIFYLFIYFYFGGGGELKYK